MKRICIWLTVVALIATSAAVLPGTIKAGAAGGVSIAIGDPVFIDEKPGCFNLGLATISGSDTISSMTVSVTNGYIKEAGDMSNAIADKYTNHQTITWLWTTPKSMDNATAFLRSLVFSYAEPMTITITVDGNETKIPKGTTVTSYTPDGETKPHYYMFVPFSGNTAVPEQAGYGYAVPKPDRLFPFLLQRVPAKMALTITEHFRATASGIQTSPMAAAEQMNIAYRFITKTHSIGTTFLHPIPAL